MFRNVWPSLQSNFRIFSTPTKKSQIQAVNNKHALYTVSSLQNAHLRPVSIDFSILGFSYTKAMTISYVTFCDWLFQLVSCFQNSYILQQILIFHSFYCQRVLRIVLSWYILVYSSVNENLDCFQIQLWLLWIMSYSCHKECF